MPCVCSPWRCTAKISAYTRGVMRTLQAAPLGCVNSVGRGTTGCIRSGITDGRRDGLDISGVAPLDCIRSGATE